MKGVVMDALQKVIGSLGWPHIALIIGIFFMIIFRVPIATFIGRIRTVGKAGVTTETSPLAQSDEKRKIAVDELMKVGDSIVLKELEHSTVKDLSSRGLDTEGDTVKVLIRNLAATQLALDYEQIYNLIYGSQILLLRRLNEAVGQGRLKEYMDDYFLKVKSKHQDLFTWSFEQYLDFLFKRALIITVDGKYHITTKGVDFLTWIVRNGRTEDTAHWPTPPAFVSL